MSKQATPQNYPVYVWLPEKTPPAIAKAVMASATEYAQRLNEAHRGARLEVAYFSESVTSRGYVQEARFSRDPQAEVPRELQSESGS